MTRLTRSLTTWFVALATAAWLSACGFQLRTPPQMNFRTIQLTGFASNSPLAAELARAIEASGATVVDSTLQATQGASGAAVPATHIILEALRDSRDEAVASTTAYGQVRDMLARTTLRYRILRGDGSELVPPTSLELNNTLSFDEKDALAKADEYDALHRAMQTDIVAQVIRRLAALRPEQLAFKPASAASGPISAASRAAD